jgi:hypothetical protein
MRLIWISAELQAFLRNSFGFLLNRKLFYSTHSDFCLVASFSAQLILIPAKLQAFLCNSFGFLLNRKLFFATHLDFC